MSLTVCVLASGSSGNCIYVASETTSILVDAGLSCRTTEERLEQIGVNPADIKAVCVTHEHSDHKDGLGVLFRKYGIQPYANSGTIEAIENDKRLQGLPWNRFTTGFAFEIGDLTIEPFSVPHDSYDPVGFIINSDSSRLGIVTDMGMVTELVKERMRKCDAVVIESNHDEHLLRDSGRPWSLKQRISSRQGHLSNSQSGDFLAEIASSRLGMVFLAHLSSDCNTPELAMKAAEEALVRCGRTSVRIVMTYQARISEKAQV